MYFHLPTFARALRLTLTRRPVSLRHALLAFTVTGLFLALRTVVAGLRLADRIFYPDYGRQAVEPPLFIIGNPRSGTTFCHRLLAGDGRFTHLRLWQTIFPTVCGYRLAWLLERLDRALGSPLARMLTAITDKSLGWEKIHATGAAKAESDEMYFVHAFASPLLTLLFPYFRELSQAVAADTMPPAQRARLRDSFADCLRRHLYATRLATGRPQVLLEKVALIAGRLELVLEALPGVRIVHLVRHPYQSVPSLMSMWTASWQTLCPHLRHDPEALAGLKAMIFDYYRRVHAVGQALPPERFMVLRYEDLVADPKAAVQAIYDKFGLPMSAEYHAHLEAETARARTYSSRHAYGLEDFGLTREEIHRELKEIFDAHGFPA